MPVSMNVHPTKTQQAGSVILEALIAILIFSIGILALVGMQATAISNVADAKYRSTSAYLANQIIGTMWATRQIIIDPLTLLPRSGVLVANPDPTFACNLCTTANGNAYTQAWIANGVAAELPNGTASITINGAVVTVAVNWTPPNATVVHRHTIQTYVD